MTGHDQGIGRETALVSGDDGIVGIGTEVYHRSQVKVDPEICQGLGYESGLLVSRLQVVEPTQVLVRYRGRETVPLFQSSDDATFLIDGDQQRCGRGRLQGRNQCFHLGGGFDVAHCLLSGNIVIEENDAAHMALPDVLHDEMLVVHVQAAEPNHQHLSNFEI